MSANIIESEIHDLYATSGIDESNSQVIIKVVNAAPVPRNVTMHLDGDIDLASEGTAEILTSANRLDENTLENPDLVKPVRTPIKNISGEFDYQFAANSLTIIKIRIH